MRVLVVGGAGYIGSHVSLALKDAGHQVHIIDNFYSGLRVNLHAGNGFSHSDLQNPGWLREAVKEAGSFDAAIHLAAFKGAGESMVKPEKYSTGNLNGTVNLLNVMTELKIGHLVFSSSAAVYGEPAYLPIDEKHPTNPENYYGFTKLEIERILSWYSKLRDLRFAALRYFNAAGYDPEGRVQGLEQNPANLLPIVMEAAVGARQNVGVFGNDYPTPDGTGVRDYVHVSDLARAHVLALEHIVNKKTDLTVNLGSEEGISVSQMIESARRITKKPVPAEIKPRRPGDPAKLVASSSLAHSTLGWKAKLSDVDNLISSTWNVYRKTFGV